LKNTFVIAIAGASGSGKSSLAKNTAKQLRDWYKVALLAEDAYYRSQRGMSKADRAQTNYDHPEAIEERLLIEHLTSLKRGGSVDVPVYDYSAHDRSDETISLGPCEILIVEGILLLHRQSIRTLVDLSVFIDVPESVCLERRIARDISHRGRTRESVLDQYDATVGPMYHQFVKPSMQHADMVLSNEFSSSDATEKLLLAIKNRILKQ